MNQWIKPVVAIFCLLPLALVSQAAVAKEPIYTGFFSKLAVKGYDTVAYFTEGKAVKGSEDFEFEYQGANWRFSSAEHLAMFKAAPEKYAPQYGGYCAWAVAQNKLASADPRQFHLHDGKLYLNYDAKIQAKWLADKTHLIEEADSHWPGVLD